jgi:hypothetical protein
MGALRDLSVCACENLHEDWLPASTSSGIEKLDMSDTDVTVVPAGIGTLRVLRVINCQQFIDNWLPMSYVGRIQELVVKRTGFSTRARAKNAKYRALATLPTGRYC